ncbi:MAG: hypothetical protein O2944_10570 [Proteobacteria bacterium]|nr:hypothetical protein [Pseudomonadota bacterium]
MTGARALRPGLIAVGLLSAGNALCLGVVYILYPGYVDTGEPNIVALGYRLLAGHSVYLQLDDTTRITNVYGPYLYIFHAAAFALFGPGVAIGKAPAILALTGMLTTLALSQRRHGMDGVALALGVVGAIVVLNLPTTVWDRPEAFLMCLTATALWLTNLDLSGRACWFRAAGIGALVGVAIGFKVFAAMYFLPLGLVMLVRDGVGKALLAAVIGIAVAAAPFALPAFDLEKLLALINVLKGKPNSFELLLRVLRFFLYIAAPAAILLAIGWRWVARDDRRYLGIFLTGAGLALAVVLYPAQKLGAGTYYMVPFAPLFADLAVRGYAAVKAGHSPARSAALALFLVLVLTALAVPNERRFLRNLDWPTAATVAAEIAAIERDNPGKTIEIGIGDNNESYRRTFQRTRLVFHAHPYTLDTSIVIDTTAWGIELAPGLLERMRRCATDIWLIPMGEKPFDWIGYYGKDTYGQAFRDAFHDGFEKIESRAQFDVYACRKARRS